MKKIIKQLLSIFLIIGFTGCQYVETLNEDEKKELNEIITELESSLEELKEVLNEQQPSIDANAYEAWGTVVGYWNASENRFAVLDMQDSHSAVFSYGTWATSHHSGEGRVTNLIQSGDQELTATIHFDAIEATEMDDAIGARTITVIVDYSGKEQDGKIRIKIAEGDWGQYMFAGNTQEEAHQTYLDNLSN